MNLTINSFFRFNIYGFRKFSSINLVYIINSANQFLFLNIILVCMMYYTLA